nr:uncharacterized protein LOC131772241 [Pocillopora verrucosa]
MRVEIYISARCPSGWEYFQGSCYWFSDHSQPQSHAVNTCRVRGADLPKVTSIEENNFLKKSGYSWWLDLRRDSTHKSIFRWSDGSLADFTNWKSGDHSDNSKECVEQEDTGEWNTVLCTTNRKIACKKENIDVILATGTVSKRSAGIVFGFQEFTQTYHLSVSAGPHIWEARLPDYPLGWVHVGITWSNQWGLRFYQNGVLTVESTSPARLLYATESTFPRISNVSEIMYVIYGLIVLPTIFNANWDENTVVYNTINPVIFARYIRVMPKTWKSHISMRVEFYDCGGSEYNVFKADELLSQAEYVWTFDHLNDIKDLPGKTWAERSALLQSTTGVRGRAVSTAGGAGPIRLHDDSEKSYLVWPLKSAQVTVALWLLYHSKVPPDFQTFLASAEEVSGGRGIHLFQMDGSKEELTFRVTVGNGRCFVKFHAPQGVWTHWVFTWKKVNNKLSEDMTVYRNGKAVDDLLQNTCEARNYPEITNFDFTIGSHTLPKASFDDIIVWLKLLSTSEVEELFSYYEGRANLHVNVSLELTDEEFNLEYRNITSEIFKYTSTWIESQVRSLHQNNSLLSVDNFVFW